MEALTISAANLDTIEKNLGAVANELTGVITNVTSVNNQVNKVEEKVASLNDEVKNLMKEIRENTIITNARQSIMYNNEQIEKKYGYYDSVRRTTESLLDAVENSNIKINALLELEQELILNHPNYWLTNALAALVSWLLNDHENTEKELQNALKKDAPKTSLFFCLVNLKINRANPAFNWLKKYLSTQNPLNLDKDFVTVLDLAATGSLGNEAKALVFNKINDWQQSLKGEKQIQEKQINKWFNFITENEEDNVNFKYLLNNCKDIEILKRNLHLTSSYLPVYNKLDSIIYSDEPNKNIDTILNNLIYEYETSEQTYQKDNLRNQLLISCNGNREEAEKLFQKQESVYDKEEDLITLLSNIVINKDLYKISPETEKIALSLTKEYLVLAYERKRKEINKNYFNINVDNFNTKTQNGTNKSEINEELEIYLNKEFNDEDKDLIIILLIINILGIIGIFITLNNKILSTILIVILILGNLILFYKLNKRSVMRNKEKNKLRARINNELEKILAETVDYTEILANDEKDYENIINFLKDLNATAFTNSNNERNIEVGE